jgi:ketosteroid isomerase-like protein
MRFMTAVMVVLTGTIAAAQTARTLEESAIIAADTAFNQAVADRSVERFLALIADDATFAGGGAPLHGHDEIRAGWARYFAADGPTLTWAPRTAQVLAAGRDVGVTTGSWVLRATDANGRPTEARGDYLTVWRKDPDGAWRAVFDTGSNAP